MKTKWIPISTLILGLAAPIAMMGSRAYAAPTPAAPGFYQEGRWDQPPDGFRDAQRDGFRAGIDAAHQDIDNHRHRDAEHHERFRHPPVDRDHVRDYRDGFRRGYDTAWRHFEEHHGW